MIGNTARDARTARPVASPTAAKATSDMLRAANNGHSPAAGDAFLIAT